MHTLSHTSLTQLQEFEQRITELYIQYGNSPLQQIWADFKYWEGHPNLGACPRGMTSKEGILGIVLPFIIKICAQCLQNRMRNLDYFTSFSTVPAGWPVAAVITFLAKGSLLTTLPLSKRTCDPLFPFYFSSPSPTPFCQRRHAHWAKTSLYNWLLDQIPASFSR